MAETDETQIELHLLGKLLRPSYVSGLVAGVITLAIVGSAFISKLYLSTGWLADALHTITNADSGLFQYDTGDGNSPFNMSLLFVFWAFVGLIVYFMVIGAFHAFAEARAIEQEMNYVHSDRREILRNFVGRLLMRIVGVILLFGVTVLYLKAVLPYSLSTIREVKFDLGSIAGVTLAIVMLLLLAHVMTILLRLLALRPRLFSAEID